MCADSPEHSQNKSPAPILSQKAARRFARRAAALRANLRRRRQQHITRAAEAVCPQEWHEEHESNDI